MPEVSIDLEIEVFRNYTLKAADDICLSLLDNEYEFRKSEWNMYEQNKIRYQRETAND